MENNEKKFIPVLLSGTVVRTPGVYLTPEREVGCSVCVRSLGIVFSRSACGERRRARYTVRICSPLTPFLIRCAERGRAVLVPGLLAAGTALITAQIMFALAE